MPLVFLGIIHVTATAQLREKLEPSRFPPFLRRSLPADGLDPGDYCQVGLVLNPFYEPVRDGGRKWQPRPANEVVQLVDMSLLVDFDLEKIEAGMLRGIARERSRNLRDWDWFLATDPETKYAQPHPQVPIPPRPCRGRAYRYPQIEILVSTDNALDYGTQGFSKIDFAQKRQKSGNNVISWRSFTVKISWNQGGWVNVKTLNPELRKVLKQRR